MSEFIVTRAGIQLAEVTGRGEAVCLARLGDLPGRPFLCRTHLQRTYEGSLDDGVRAHYKTVHPEKRF